MVRIYNCFHDRGSMPADKYISPLRPALLCGAGVSQRQHSDIANVLRDNVGENISDQNLQYSELTGYYWIWKNENVDIVGIEHYRRHFIKPTAKITNSVSQNDLIDENDIVALLADCDMLVPAHQSLANTSIFDLYVICFHEQATEIVRNMKHYFQSKNLDNFILALYQYMSNNFLIRANMLIMRKPEFDNYCSIMFDMIDYLKEHMVVQPNSRVWGYVTELFPMIYILATDKFYKEIDIAVDDKNWETGEESVYVTIGQKEEPFDKDSEIQIEFFRSL